MFYSIANCGCNNNVVYPNRCHIPSVIQIKYDLTAACRCRQHSCIHLYLLPVNAAANINTIDLEGRFTIGLIPEAQIAVLLEKLNHLCSESDFNSSVAIATPFLEFNCLVTAMCVICNLNSNGTIVGSIARIYTIKLHDQTGFQITNFIVGVTVHRHMLQCVHQHIAGVVNGNNGSIACSNSSLLDRTGGKASDLRSSCIGLAANLCLDELALQNYIAILMLYSIANTGNDNDVINHHLMI